MSTYNTDISSLPADQSSQQLLTSKPHRVFEINDQSWWPDFLRLRIQSALTLAWTNQFPVLQNASPSAAVVRVLQKVLGKRLKDYIYVDFASGAGGPTPYIEKTLNEELRKRDKNEAGVEFVLTDISPHAPAWEAACKKSENLHYVPTSVDAAGVTSNEALLRDVAVSDKKKVMRLFSLAFHHFDDELARKILKNTIETSDGFCIFELQQRTYPSLLTILALWPMLMLTAPFYYLHDPIYMFFTYCIPAVPFVVQFDGFMSQMRTRTAKEVHDLLKQAARTDGGHEDRLQGWEYSWGEELHTFPNGKLSWVICYKDEQKS